MHWLCGIYIGISGSSLVACAAAAAATAATDFTVHSAYTHTHILYIHASHSLLPIERQVLRMRYGLTGGPCMTLKTVGMFFGISKERTRQIEARAFAKLRSQNYSRGASAADIAKDHTVLVQLQTAAPENYSL
jgi:DNA-directed RNA polymerase sigma subunit (sigma70/sigma32)